MKLMRRGLMSAFGADWAFDFMGSTNIIPAALHGRELYLDGKLVATLSGSILPGGAVDIYVRPGDLRATGAVSYTHLTLPTNREV